MEKSRVFNVVARGVAKDGIIVVIDLVGSFDDYENALVEYNGYNKPFDNCYCTIVSVESSGVNYCEKYLYTESVSSSKWVEIHNDYYDEISDTICIDAWETDNEDEEGKVIATLNGTTAQVVYYDEDAKTDALAQMYIFESVFVIKNMKNNS